MAFNLTKDEKKRLAEYRDRLGKEQSDMSAILEEQAEVIEAAYEKINGAIETYNGVLADARGFIEDIVSERNGDFEDKSERWQEGERGEVIREWIDSFDNAMSELEDVEAIEHESFSVDVAHSDVLDALEEEPAF